MRHSLYGLGLSLLWWPQKRPMGSRLKGRRRARQAEPQNAQWEIAWGRRGDWPSTAGDMAERILVGGLQGAPRC